LINTALDTGISAVPLMWALNVLLWSHKLDYAHSVRSKRRRKQVMYGTLKRIAEYVGLAAILITIALLLVQARTQTESARRVLRNWTLVGASLSLVAYVGSVLVFGPLQARQDKLAAYSEPIRSATASVSLVIECEETYKGTHFAGTFCALARGDSLILCTLTNQFIGRSLNENRSLLTFNAELDKAASVLPESVSALTESEYAKITLGKDKIPDGARLIEGEIVFTVNGSFHIEVDVPSQEIHNSTVFVRDLEGVFASFQRGR